jgi:hypothetical protein
MDRNEARLLLQAYRPNGADAGHGPFQEAIAIARRDPELMAWWEAQQAFDRKVAAKLLEVPLPEQPGETLLAGPKITRPRFRYQPYAFAAAAAVALLCVALSYFQPWRSSSVKLLFPMARDEYAVSVLQFVDQPPTLGLMDCDDAKIVEWLHQRHAPSGNFPVPMGTLPPFGCQKLAVHGHTVSLICFTMKGGELVHLFTVDAQALKDAPGLLPEYRQIDGWSTAAWSDGSMTYLLATRASPDKLKQLL